MIRLSAPALLGVVLVSAVVGFGLGSVVGPMARPVSAAETQLTASGSFVPTGIEDPPVESTGLVSVNEMTDSGGPASREGTALVGDPHQVSEASLRRAVKRVEAPGVEVPSGTAVIAGRVTTKSGDPVAGVEVVATPAPPSLRPSRKGSEAQVTRALVDLDEVLAKAAKAWAEGQGRSVSTQTGADGSFRIAGLADLSYRVRAQAEGMRFESRENGLINPIDAPDAKVAIEAEPLNSIEVLVVGVDGGAVSEAIVKVNGEALEWTAEDPVVFVTQKQFRLQAVAEPFAIGARGSAARFVSDFVPVDVVADPDRVVTLQLEAACSVSGRIVGERVTNDSWQSIHAVPLRVDEPFDATLPASGDISVNAREDTFLFADLRPGRYAVCLIGPGGIPVDHKLVDVVPGMVDVELQREVHDPSKYLAIHGVSPRGTAVEGFNARIEYQKPGSEVSSDWVRSKNLPDGTRLIDVSDLDDFDYDEWDAGAKVWLVVDSNVYGKVREPLAQGQREVTVQFEDPCELVVQLEGDVTMGGFVVKVLDADTEHTEPPTITQANQRSSRGRTRIDAGGKAKFQSLSPGPVIVTLSQAGYWWGEGNEIARVELDLTGRDHQVSLEVPPVSDLSVVLTPCDERHYLELVIKDEDGEEHEVASTRTTEDGRAIFRGLPPGEYEIQDSETGAKVAAVVPGPEVRVDLEEHVIKLTVSVNKLDGKLAEWGLAGGDLIVAIDGDPIEDRSMLMDRMHGDGVTVTVERGEETLEIELPRYPRETRDGNPLGGWVYIDS